MFEFLFKMNDIPLYALLTCSFIAISLLGITLVKIFIPLEVRYKDNGTVGNTISLIAVIFAVLVGFTALYLINNNSTTDDAVEREANATADIYRDSKWLKDPVKINVQELIKKYITEVVNVEWPLMKTGATIDLKDGNDLLDKITNELIHYSTTANSESLLLHDMLDEVRTLADSREQRIHGSYSELSPELWVVIILGTILTLGMNYLFGMNFYIHMITITGVSVMAASIIFLLITIDRPFQGEFAIDPDTFNSLLTFIENDKNNHHPTL